MVFVYSPHGMMSMITRVLTEMAFRTLCVVFLVLVKDCYSQLDVCGTAPLNTRIVGGVDATADSWPWQVSLQSDGNNFCGGSLINKDWVLSAAHCFSSSRTVTIKLGLLTLEGFNPNNQTRTVAETIIHPNYIAARSDNDIALLRMSSSVTFNSHITPICLAAAQSTFFNGTETWVTGWGRIAVGVSLPSPGTLQEVAVSVIGNRKCNCAYGVGRITSNMICAGNMSGGQDSCQGDSGGPLVIKNGSRWLQIGVVSFGESCALADFPGVYARVSVYEDWIKSTITTNQPGFITYTSSGTDSDLQVTCAGLPAITTVPPTTPAPTTAPVVCGSASPNSILETGSSLASAGTWPWIASLQFNGSHVCGGTLIAEQFVMSSADCFSSSANPSNWTVILGRLNQNGTNPNEVSVSVFNITFSQSAQDNIAVLMLSSKPTLSNFIQPICLDLENTNISTGTQCWAAGWGSGGGDQQTLQQYNTTVVSCGNISSPDSICIQAIPLEKTQEGGSLMCKIGQSWFQAAVLTIANTTESTNSTTNSTTNSKVRSGSNTFSGGFGRRSLRAEDIQVFTKISTFSNFLNTLIGFFPSPQTTSSSNSTSSSSSSTSSSSTSSSSSSTSSSGCEVLPSLSVISVLLLSLLAFIQTFVFESEL